MISRSFIRPGREWKRTDIGRPFSLQAEAGGQESGVFRALSVAGNALFFTALGGAAFFGYYTYRYSAQEVEEVVRERKRPENAFPGSSVILMFLLAIGSSN
jgi:hypothetical protein